MDNYVKMGRKLCQNVYVYSETLKFLSQLDCFDKKKKDDVLILLTLRMI